jgi:hypothetical protein
LEERIDPDAIQDADNFLFHETSPTHHQTDEQAQTCSPAAESAEKQLAQRKSTTTKKSAEVSTKTHKNRPKQTLAAKSELLRRKATLVRGTRSSIKAGLKQGNKLLSLTHHKKVYVAPLGPVNPNKWWTFKNI